MQTSMNNIDVDVCKVSALKNDSLKEIEAALRAIKEELNHVSNLLNRERKRKHQALEAEEKEVEDRCFVDQLELKLKQRCKGKALIIAKGVKTGRNRRKYALCSQLWCAGSCFSQLCR